MNEEQADEMRRLKEEFPFRIVWGALSLSGQWKAGANVTRRKPNDLLRKGWRVWIAK